MRQRGAGYAHPRPRDTIQLTARTGRAKPRKSTLVSHLGARQSASLQFQRHLSLRFHRKQRRPPSPNEALGARQAARVIIFQRDPRLTIYLRMTCRNRHGVRNGDGSVCCMVEPECCERVLTRLKTLRVQTQRHDRALHDRKLVPQQPRSPANPTHRLARATPQKL